MDSRFLSRSPAPQAFLFRASFSRRDTDLGDKQILAVDYALYRHQKRVTRQRKRTINVDIIVGAMEITRFYRKCVLEEDESGFLFPLPGNAIHQDNLLDPDYLLEFEVEELEWDGR